MRHLIVEAWARVLLVLAVGVLCSAQITRPDKGAAIAREANVYGSPVADRFQTQQAYLGNSEKEESNDQPPGYISGTILDQSGAVAAGADVRLTDESQASNQEVKSGSNGQFLFANVTPGPFRLTVTSPGFATRELSADLGPGETYLVPPIILTVATGAIEVHVRGSPLTPVQVADMQIKEQEKQRVLGLIPNFYVSYGHDALRLNTNQKFRLAWKTTADPFTILGVAALAGPEQATNAFDGYGQGAQGYFKRLGASYADAVTGTFIGSAMLPSLLKQDPRYFYKGSGGTRSRLLYALASPVICKGDNMRWQPNYSNVAGSFASAGISYLYYPQSDRNGAGLVVQNSLIRLYFASGIALLDERDWGGQHALKFSLCLECAECELLCGSLEKAAQLIVELLQRAASDIEFADASCLKVNLHVLTGEHSFSIESALRCLRRLGIDLPAHPTFEQVRAEYETVSQALKGRPVESLIDLPLMTDPKIMAAMQVLSVLAGPATFTDFQLFCLLACRMVNISIQHGMSGASAYAYACLGSVLGPNFHRYREGYRLARLACDLVEKHAFTAYDTKIYHAMGLAAFWTEPLTSVIELRRATTRTATERGDLTFACYGMHQSITYLLMRNDPLDAVWRESEMALDFARRAKFRDVVDLIGSQQRFIASLQGRDATFSTFSDERFDEAAFEVELTAARTPTVICLYWIRKLKVRYLSGDYAEAHAAAEKAKTLLRISTVQLQLFDYFYYAALTVAALYEDASADEQTGWRELLRAHREQLREWAENNAPTFFDKHALVSAELARIEGRDADAMRLYEHAIQSAREHGFVQKEGVAHEIAARFYAARGVESIAHVYRRNARTCYSQWGALGKVKQLEERYPSLREERLPALTASTIGTPVRQLDVETVVKASQALSSEIVLSNLIEKLMRIAVEHAGAERGLLILLHGEEPRIEAEATIGHGKVEVAVRQTVIRPLDLPQSALQYVIRTRGRVVLDDASAGNLYSEDEYVRAKHSRSVLCLPIVKQSKLIGALYLENNLTPRAFTSDRVAVLEMLASQAAISLENANLYSDLHRSEAFLAQGQNISHTGSFGWSVSSGEIYWSEETYTIFDYDRMVKPTWDKDGECGAAESNG